MADSSVDSGRRNHRADHAGGAVELGDKDERLTADGEVDDDRLAGCHVDIDALVGH